MITVGNRESFVGFLAQMLVAICCDPHRVPCVALESAPLFDQWLPNTTKSSTSKMSLIIKSIHERSTLRNYTHLKVVLLMVKLMMVYHDLASLETIIIIIHDSPLRNHYIIINHDYGWQVLWLLWISKCHCSPGTNCQQSSRWASPHGLVQFKDNAKRITGMVCSWIISNTNTAAIDQIGFHGFTAQW